MYIKHTLIKINYSQSDRNITSSCFFQNEKRKEKKQEDYTNEKFNN